MRYMGLDMSTRTGQVIVDASAGKYTLLLAEEVKYPTALRGMRRAGAIAKGVLDRVEEFKPDRIIIEDYGFSHRGSAIINIELAAVIKYFLYQEGYDELFKVPPTSLKQFVTDSGKAEKDIMIKAVYKRWRFDTENDNIADAFALAMFGATMAGDILVPAISMAVIQKLLNPKPKKVKKKTEE